MSEHERASRTAAGSACPRITGGSPGPVSLRALMTILRAQRSPYLPTSLDIVRIPDVGPALRVAYPAPSPLGLLGSGG